jgi:SAM-dependent methyltransferase
VSSNVEVRSFWEQEPCGTGREIVAGAAFHSREWFEQVERYRYDSEPFIHNVAQFTRHHGKTILEVGVGAGTDHLQWARAGCRCHGVDLTDAAIETAREHLALYGFQSELRRVDAETLPFDDDLFDVVYSWGVIHHTARPDRIVHEIHRVLKPRGLFIGMMYGRHSITALRLWAHHALLAGRPWRSISEIVAAHVESAGTKAYTVAELERLFASFHTFTAKPVLSVLDRSGWPSGISRFFPSDWGWFVTLSGQK